MAVITISRQYASGGSDIARLVAQRLGWTLIDNEFVDRVAARAGCTVEEVQQQEERVPTLIERLARALTVSAPEMFAAAADPQVTLPPEDRLVRLTEAVIAEAVQQGDVVMVGRGAQSYLAQREQTLHVLVAGPRDLRLAEAIRRLGGTADDAAKRLDDVDEGRRRYVKTHYNRNWDDPAGYDLVVNTGRFPYEVAADLIVEAARGRGLIRPAAP
ncbi:MAG TPA: cytidylate kinase-like family protein [Gemmatimonadales bacterium]